MLTASAPPGAPPRAVTDVLDRLVARVAHGDRYAFRRVYAALAARTWSAVTAAMHGDHRGLPVLYGTFVEVWYFAGRFDPDAGSAPGWVRGIGMRRAEDRLRLLTQTGPHGHAAMAGYDTLMRAHLADLLGPGHRLPAGTLTGTDVDVAPAGPVARPGPQVSGAGRLRSGAGQPHRRGVADPGTAGVVFRRVHGLVGGVQ